MKHRVKLWFKEYGSMLFKDSFSLMKKSGLNLFLFEVIYKLFFIAVFYPVLVFGVSFTLKKAGINYLTNNYLYAYLKNPFTIIFILLALLLLVFYISYEVSCLSVCFDAAQHGEKIAISQIFKGGIKLLRVSVKKRKIDSFFHIAIISVMMNITLLGYFLANFKLNSAAKEIILKKQKLLIVLGILLFALFIYCLFHIFTINYITYDGEDIKDSRRRSVLLIKRRMFKTFMVLLGWNVIIFVGIYVIYFLLTLILIAGVFILKRANLGMAIYLSVFKVVITVVKIAMPVVSVPISFSVITGMFFRYRGDTGNELFTGVITENVINKKRINIKFQKVIASIFAIILLAVNVFYLVRSFNHNPFKNLEYFDDTQVMAHRGGSIDAPENTMYAFENAVAATADFIELDVHETKDGQIVVIHDNSLLRTTGCNKKVYDMNYEDIRALDASNKFGSEEFPDCYVPLLSEVMDYTKGKIKLNIEIKLSSKEPHLVQKVVELIEEYGYESDCVVTSMSYDALVQVKKLDENIATGYVLQVAYGDYYNIDYVDAISINYAYVDKGVVDAIHNSNKEIYVWTINSKSIAERMTLMGVDALITDNPSMAREVVFAKYSNPLIANILSYVFKE